jgi:hypothetical protein
MSVLRIDRTTDRGDLFTRLNPVDFSKLELTDDSIILLISQSDEKRLAAVKSDNSCPPGSIQLSHLLRVQLKAHSGDPMSVSLYSNLDIATSVTFTPIKETISFLTPQSNLQEIINKLHFQHFPVTLGSSLSVFAFQHCFEFGLCLYGMVLADALSRMLKQSAAERITIAELAQHPWIRRCVSAIYVDKSFQAVGTTADWEMGIGSVEMTRNGPRKTEIRRFDCGGRNHCDVDGAGGECVLQKCR